ncbi:3-hydroxybutyryl-CoA dehydrogenase [Spelaeicoccus albus]|uniref:3-hydroxybutyryl-CoA dehydrogenase n=1 Tax=Spelaeicoccus albus TaxID=1280376 RepID=A0A7Z0D3U2_9MICO|nr:3-hydroxybutyryl-CoA dehydrogenase [Spelaeicoccus albus]NYI68369.1 3-hydroxybutyryl-CoA dehydrogenase [Spelaeicoccus albus]
MQLIGVVGCGLMGSGIAEVAAKAGLDVIVRDINEQAVDAGRARIGKSLNRAVERGKLTAERRDAVLSSLRFTTDISELADRDLVIEAASENEEIKKSVFADLDAVVTKPDAVLASNTSSMPIVRFAKATSRPERVVGMHFFNPAPVQPLVEIVSSVLTAPDVVDAVRSLAEDVLGKVTISAQDRPGFIVNALLVPYLLSAIRMYESGAASLEDIDAGMVNGCAHPMGPMRLNDLVGLDTTLAIAKSVHAETGDPAYAPPVLLSRMVDAGFHGKKAGRGFYNDYS